MNSQQRCIYIRLSQPALCSSALSKNVCAKTTGARCSGGWGEAKSQNRDIAMMVEGSFSGSLQASEGTQAGNLDQQEVPTLRQHHVSPGDIMRFATTGAEAAVDVAPDLLQDRGDTAEVPKVGKIAQLDHPLVEE